MTFVGMGLVRGVLQYEPMKIQPSESCQGGLLKLKAREDIYVYHDRLD